MQLKLFLFSADYPYGTGETFLETEINYLAERFEKIVILTQNTEGHKARPVPANCEIKRINLTVSWLEKIGSLTGVFDAKFWEERNIIKTVYNKKLNKGVISTMLISLLRAKKTARFTKTLYRYNQQNSKVFFYSYWCDDIALGIAMFQKKNPEIHTLSRIHRWDVYFEESEFNYLPYRHYIIDNIGKIFSISQDGIYYAIKNWKTNSNQKFVLSRLGVNNSIPFDVSKNKIYLILSCSNLIPVKRVHLIAEALKEIDNFRIKWVHFGDGLEKKSLEKITEVLPINIEVEFKGSVPNIEIYTYYNENRPDLFINVSSSEGVPVSIMEAMSFGVPVIGTNVGGVSEIVNGKNGYLINPNPNPSQIAKKLYDFYILSNKNKLEKKKAAFKTWDNKYNAEKNYTEFADDILSL